MSGGALFFLCTSLTLQRAPVPVLATRTMGKTRRAEGTAWRSGLRDAAGQHQKRTRTRSNFADGIFEVASFQSSHSDQNAQRSSSSSSTDQRRSLPPMRAASPAGTASDATALPSSLRASSSASLRAELALSELDTLFDNLEVRVPRPPPIRRSHASRTSPSGIYEALLDSLLPLPQ